MRWPFVETAEHWVTVAAACPLEEALTLALHEMIRLVMALTGDSAHDAYLLVGVAGHARPGQVQGGLYTMRCLLPKSVLPAGVHVRTLLQSTH
jgi:acetamidase/formamidase